MTDHLPNLLTLGRIAIAPYIFFLMWTAAFENALIWFGIAALTDALDGFLARRLGVSSRIGALLDPLADKILLSGSFLVLALAGAIPGWLAIVVLGRDALLLAGAAVALKARLPRDLAPSVWGKGSTVVQMLYLMAVLAGLPVGLFAYVTAAITVGSGAAYVWRYFRPLP